MRLEKAYERFPRATLIGYYHLVKTEHSGILLFKIIRKADNHPRQLAGVSLWYLYTVKVQPVLFSTENEKGGKCARWSEESQEEKGKS